MPSNFTPTPAWQPENVKGGMRFAFPPYGPPGLIRGQARQGGVEAAETQPLGQAAQGLIHQEFH